MFIAAWYKLMILTRTGSHKKWMSLSENKASLLSRLYQEVDIIELQNSARSLDGQI